MGTKLRLARFTLETMDIWQIIVRVVLAALVVAWVAIIAYNKGRVSGRVSAQQAAASDETALCLFGDDVPVRPTERRLVEVLPEALIVTDRNGRVQYASPGSVPFGLVSGNRLNSREVEDILTQAATDGGVREREVQMPVNRSVCDRCRRRSGRRALFLRSYFQGIRAFDRIGASPHRFAEGAIFRR